ncbi:DUF2513 domain-containing protein [Dyella jiangningensis]|nr:DUF2513 domain-containing protein [Dyella jiangningensis]
MKRDWDLVRQILLELEEVGHDRVVVHDDGQDTNVFGYHCKLMHDAGLIEANITEYHGGAISGQAVRMTWAGHEFLDSIRPKSTWEKVKMQAKEKGIGLTLDAIKTLAEIAMKAAIAG